MVIHLLITSFCSHCSHFSVSLLYVCLSPKSLSCIFLSPSLPDINPSLSFSFTFVSNSPDSILSLSVSLCHFSLSSSSPHFPRTYGAHTSKRASSIPGTILYVERCVPRIMNAEYRKLMKENATNGNNKRTDGNIAGSAGYSSPPMDGVFQAI